MERRALLWPEVTRALDSLRADFDWVVIEGAGSPAEINLTSSDIVNMAVARHAEAPVLLVTDIDRGGAFASLVGTWTLLAPEDRARIRGFVLNRFRGDRALLGNAPDVLREATGVPVLGVVPWVRTGLPEEDAATIERLPASKHGAVGVVRFPCIANFDDVLPLEEAPDVGIRWVERPPDLGQARAIVLPGSRNVAGDLRWLRATGLDVAIRERVAVGVPVLGICGGLQMLGARVDDPLGLEGGGSERGLGLLPVSTSLGEVKTVRRVCARWLTSGGDSAVLTGYEIHHGRTSSSTDGFMWDREDELRVLGFRRGVVSGTCVHGCLGDAAFRGDWLGLAGFTPGALVRATPEPHRDPIDVVADAVEASISLEELLA
jgi:adenosylcobyric acid synthase